MDENPQPSDPTDDESSWRDKRRERPRHGSPGGPLIGSLLLILLGSVFLARNLGFIQLENWWALFFLIPAVGALGGAYAAYRRHGGVTSRVAGSLVAALIFLALSIAFLIGLDWGVYWPITLVLVGLAMLIGRYCRR